MTLGSARLLIKVSTYDVQHKTPVMTFRLKNFSLSLRNSNLKLIKITPINLFHTSMGQFFPIVNTNSLMLFERVMLFIVGITQNTQTNGVIKMQIF
jgi:hypothetical protein